MRRYLLIVLCLVSVGIAFSQEMNVKSMYAAESDSSAVANPRLDLNNTPCALLKISLRDTSPEFEGNVLGDVKYDGQYFWVYMSSGSKYMRIVPSDSYPLMISFGDYGIKQLESLQTYYLTIGTSESLMEEMTEAIKSETKKEEAPLEYERFNVKGVKFAMVRVEGGTFIMGDNKTTGDWCHSTPPHQVTLSTFYIANTETTLGLWRAVMGKDPSRYAYTDDYPVEQVNWDECQKFIKKLNKLTGRKFRLPTEAEWEFAARGGNFSKGYAYSGSDSIDEVARYHFPNSGTTYVCKKKPNELGLYDMSGNVWEWCSDAWYEYDDSPQTNPRHDGDEKTKRVIRGGSFATPDGWCEVEARDKMEPDERDRRWLDDVGFRLVLSE